MTWGKLLVILGLLTLMYGCARPQYPTLVPYQTPTKAELDKRLAEKNFIKARWYERRGQLEMAIFSYKQAYKLDSVAVLKEILVDRYILTKKYANALELLLNDSPIDSLADNSLKKLSHIFYQMKNYDKAAYALSLCKKNDIKDLAYLGQLYELGKNFRAAIITYEQCFAYGVTNDKMVRKIATLSMRDRQYDKAVTYYSYLDSVKNGEDISAINGLGKALFYAKKDDDAFKNYKRALTIDSTNSETLDNISDYYIAKQDFHKAIEYLQRIKDGTTDYLSRYYHKKTLVMLYYQTKQFSKAEVLLYELLEDNLNDFELHYYLGLVYAEQGKIERAQLQFGKTLALKNTHEGAWRNICYMLIRNKQFDLALEKAYEYISYVPTAIQGYDIISYIYKTENEYEKAEDALVKALKIDSTNRSILYDLGALYERQKKYIEATETFETLLRHHPDYAPAANYLGYMWVDQGIRLEEAKVLIEKALAVEPKNGAYLDSYAWVYFKLGNYEKAYEYMILALKEYRDDPIMFEHLGDILVKLKKYSEAVGAYTQALSLKPDNADIITKKIKELQEQIN